MALSGKQRAFVDEYLKCWNQTEAARRAGYSERSARSIGSENLTKPDIAAEIQKRIAERCMGADEALDRLAQQARGTIEPFIRQVGEGIALDITTDQAKDNIHLIRKIKTKRRSGGRGDSAWTEIETEIEMYDAQAALVHIGRHHKLFTDSVEHSWRDEATRAGVDPNAVLEQLVAGFLTQMAGGGGGGGVGGGEAAGGGEPAAAVVEAAAGAADGGVLQ